MNPANSYCVQPAVLSDYDGVRELEKPDKERVGLIPAKALVRRIRMGDVYVVRELGDVLGYAVTYSHLRPWQLAQPLHQIVVRAEFRRRRIATALVTALLERAAFRGRWWTIAWCRASLPANRLFQSLGFHCTHIRAGGEKRHVPLLLWQRPSPEQPPAISTCFWEPTR